MADSNPFSGIGDIIGAGLASDAIGSGLGAVGANTSAGVAQLEPYNAMGMLTMPDIADNLLGDTVGSNNIGNGRVNAEVNPVDFENFAKNYAMSEGAKVDLQAGLDAGNATAAAKGGLLSGANQRAQATIAEGIASKDLLAQYQAMLTGQQQDFSQRQTSYTNLFNQEQLGEKAAAGQAATYASANSATASLYGAQAKADQTKGSGIGSAIGGIANLATKF